MTWTVESSGTCYALSGDVHIAYRLFGEGAFDLVFAGGLEYPSIEFHDHAIGAGFDELTARMRVIRFDKRGTGASDRVSGVPSLEERMDDVRAVMDAVGSERAALLGHVDGAALAILFAATYPERVFALVLFQGKATVRSVSGLPLGADARAVRTSHATGIRGADEQCRTGARVREPPGYVAQRPECERASAGDPPDGEPWRAALAAAHEHGHRRSYRPRHHPGTDPDHPPQC
jgi:pimeloyl-ACP methyl ester carboxylesterase